MVLEAMEKVSWRVLSQCFTPDCCIAATRVGIEALKPFGIAGRAMPTRTAAMNASYWAYTKGEVSTPDESARVLVVDDSCDDGTGFPGHLVIVGKVKGTPFLMDLSVFQLNRPHKQIDVPPQELVIILDPTFEFKNNWAIPVELSAGGAILYSAHPNPPDHTKMSDWYFRTPWHRKVFERMRYELIAAVRAEIGE